MSVQPAPTLPRRPVALRPVARRARLDPPNTFQAPHHVFLREPQRPAWIETENPDLSPLPVAPLAATPAAPRAQRRWLALLVASVALHAAVAGFFLLRGGDESVQIAGSQEAGVAMYGNSAANLTLEGPEDAANVAIITMTPAQPVETIDASAVGPVEAVQPVEEMVTPVEEVATERVAELAETPHAEPVPADAATAAPSPVQQVLAVDTAEVVPDEEAVAPVVPQAAAVPPPDEVVEVPEAPVVGETPEPEKPTPPPKVAETKPQPKPAEKPRAEKPVKKAEAKPTETKPAKADAPARKAEKKVAAGRGGKDKADGQRGVADGEASGTRADNAGKGKGSTAGNAAVSNYPGKVVSKLKRAVRSISPGKRRGADRDVHVAFTVTTSGALASVSVTRSSGSSALDNAALQAVRRAAPFPPIPDGRKSWNFSFPLGLR
ncbi:energy transducer TonB family protein [Mesorhizobium australicum]|uniref:Outer membrane transport energization protein TonB n=1 Tax=Mesorhizobium australicum TaxID=536018 RepID=A0A1X7PA45_9HYPH|nr:TonB family protein [Mesorhizobium australicum]SMH47103.1 outer membrane transport energization protein TonB [Mesorhizobium australicum]